MIDIEGVNANDVYFQFKIENIYLRLSYMPTTDHKRNKCGFGEYVKLKLNRLK